MVFGMEGIGQRKRQKVVSNVQKLKRKMWRGLNNSGHSKSCKGLTKYESITETNEKGPGKAVEMMVEKNRKNDDDYSFLNYHEKKDLRYA